MCCGLVWCDGNIHMFPIYPIQYLFIFFSSSSACLLGMREREVDGWMDRFLHFTLAEEDWIGVG